MPCIHIDVGQSHKGVDMTGTLGCAVDRFCLAVSSLVCVVGSLEIVQLIFSWEILGAVISAKVTIVYVDLSLDMRISPLA